MTQNSLLPPPKKGGKMLVAIAAVAALGAVFLMTQGEPEEAAPAAETENAPSAAPATSLAQHSFVVEEPPPSEPDAAVAEEPEETEAAPRARRGGGGGGGGCEGTLSASAARQVVNRNRGRVRSCYERRLKTINSLQGQVSVTLRIGTGGQVSGVRVGGSLRDPEVFSCIRSAVSSWTFPAPEGGCANLSVPFSFSPRM